MDISEDKVCIESLESESDSFVSEYKYKYTFLHVTHSDNHLDLLMVHNHTPFLYISEKPEKADREQKVRLGLVFHSCVLQQVI